MASEDFRRILDVNVVAAFQMTRAVAPHLAARGPGSVVNISSASGIDGWEARSAMPLQKPRWNAVTLSLARALAPAIRVNAICPAFMKRLDAAGAWRRQIEEFKRRTVAHTVVPDRQHAGRCQYGSFGLSIDVPHLTGELIRMDGGLHLGIRIPPKQ